MQATAIEFPHNARVICAGQNIWPVKKKLHSELLKNEEKESHATSQSVCETSLNPNKTCAWLEEHHVKKIKADDFLHLSS